jgi:hypothetical protein
VASSGQVVTLLGINLQGLQQSNDQGSKVPDECGNYWKISKTSAHDIRAWGFNSVRLPISWSNIEPQAPTRAADGSLSHHWNEEYLQAVDQVIASLDKENLVVVIDMTQFFWSSAFKNIPRAAGGTMCEGFGVPAWLHPNAANETVDDARCGFMANRPEQGVPVKPWDGLSAVWTKVAERYADSAAVVAADVFNEPFFVKPDCAGLDFPGFYETIGRTILRVVPNWLLFFQYQPERNPDFGLTSPPPFDNRVYEIHVHSPDWETAKQRFMDPAWRQAQDWKMPLYVGEFDLFSEAALRGEDWRSQALSMLQWMKERSISWAVFPYPGGGAQIKRGIARVQPQAEIISILQQGF